MGWILQQRPDSPLTKGTVVKFTLHVTALPGMRPNASALQIVLNQATPITVSSVTESLLTSFGFGDSWEVQGSCAVDTDVSTVTATVINAASTSYNWNVTVSDFYTQAIDIGGSIKNALTPSTSQAVTIAALAVLAVVGYLILKKENVL